MACYVDDVEHTFGTMVMCHLWADSLDELLAMVDRIGVQRRWIQGHPTLSFGRNKNSSWVHFDIARSMKKRALRAGAILTDKFGPVEYLAKLDLASDCEQRRQRGQVKLDQIATCRERRGQSDGWLL